MNLFFLRWSGIKSVASSRHITHTMGESMKCKIFEIAKNMSAIKVAYKAAVIKALHRV